jgi:hypothetical protein
MKKTLIALAATYLFVAVSITGASAQGTNNVIAFTETKAFTKSLEFLVFLDDSIIATNIADLNTINAKAVKDFKSRFGKAANEKWYRIPDGFVSYFTLDGFTNRALYDKKGRWHYTVKFYDESRLDHDIRALVKSTYYDCAITVVEEVQSEDNLVYIIHLEDKNSFKNVRVSKEGEMDVMEEFQKG